MLSTLSQLEARFHTLIDVCVGSLARRVRAERGRGVRAERGRGAGGKRLFSRNYGQLRTQQFYLTQPQMVTWFIYAVLVQKIIQDGGL